MKSTTTRSKCARFLARHGLTADEVRSIRDRIEGVDRPARVEVLFARMTLERMGAEELEEARDMMRRKG